MYNVNAENVDVELLAECGQIAQRLRNFEKKWCIELKDLQKRSLCTFGIPPIASSHSITQKLNDIFDINENTSCGDNDDDNNSVELVNRLRYLEDTVIKIHHQHELLGQAAFEEHKKTSHKKVHIKSNMNYSATSANNSNNSSANNNDLTTLPAAINCEHNSNGNNNNNNNRERRETGSRDNNNKNILNDDDDNDKDQQTTSNCNKQSQNIFLQQQQLCEKITDDDVKLLLRELKRKVDYTEKMNWLCKLTFQLLLLSIKNSISVLCVQEKGKEKVQEIYDFHVSFQFVRERLYIVR
jgi:hypothetical protein